MSAQTLLKTPLHSWHASHGGRMVEFGGWSMPVQYSTITEEHRAVRRHVGLFDISHMGRLLFEGADAMDWLEFATTNHVAKLAPGQIQYSLMVNEAGGVLDDILVYRIGDANMFGVVCNASNRQKVVAQFHATKGARNAAMVDHTVEGSMIAIQGPAAMETVARVVAADYGSLKYYHFTMGTFAGRQLPVSRTGYTGEDGVELMFPAERAEELWNALLSAGADLGIKPCGLGARDTLRFEASMPLYGHEMDETVNPYAAGLGWAVKLNKGEFVGRQALQSFKKSPGRTRIGLALEGKRIARQGCPVLCDGKNVGVVTSGTFAPTLNQSLAMALVDLEMAGKPSLSVDVRGNVEIARVVSLPFYQRPKL